MGYASETTGIEESTNQQSKAQRAIALNRLVVDIKRRDRGGRESPRNAEGALHQSHRDGSHDRDWHRRGH